MVLDSDNFIIVIMFLFEMFLKMNERGIFCRLFIKSISLRLLT